MKQIIIAAVAMAAISVGAYFVLGEIGLSTENRTSGPAVNLGDG